MNGQASQLQQAIQQRMAMQQANIDAQRAQVQQLRNQPQDLDLSALMNLTDAWTGSNFSKTYRRPETKQEREYKAAMMEQGLRQQEMGLIDDNIKLLSLMDKKSQDKSKDITPGQKKLDETFAKDYAEFFAGGGYADVEKNLGQLDEVITSLGQSDNLTGPWIGSMPSALQRRFAPEAAATRQAVEEVVQRNLRLVLGAQFTEKEGQRLIERAYDPAASEAENMKRVKRLRDQIAEAAQAKQDAAMYFEQHGSLKGYKGSQKYRSASDFLRDEKKSSSKKSQPKFEDMSDAELEKLYNQKMGIK